MKPNDELLIRLRKYAKGELDDMERASLEKLLQEQPELQEELAFTRSLIRATEKLEQQRLYETLEKANANVSAGPTASGRFRLLAAAAMLALLVTVAGVWWFSTQNDPLRPYQDAVYAYVEPPLSATLRGGTAERPTAQAVRRFEAGAFEEGLAILQTVSRQDSAYLEALLVQAHCHYRLGDHRGAVRSIDTLLTLSGQPAYFPVNTDNAGWTRIRALLADYMASESPDKRSALLREINAFLAAANPGDTYYKNAEALKRLLERG